MGPHPRYPGHQLVTLRRRILAIDIDKPQEFLGRFVTDLGATIADGNVVIGHRLGLYRALATGPASAEEQAPPGTGGRLAAFKGREQLRAPRGRAGRVCLGVPHA